MPILVTGSAGHLGEALMRSLRAAQRPVRGLDIKASAFTDCVDSIRDRSLVRQSMKDVHAVIHTATLHKPHVATHSLRDFIDTTVAGTLVLLEEAAAAGVGCFVFTSSTSYVNELARSELGWPKYDFEHVLESLRAGRDFRSASARAAGSKGYHDVTFDEGPYPVLLDRS